MTRKVIKFIQPDQPKINKKNVMNTTEVQPKTSIEPPRKN